MTGAITFDSNSLQTFLASTNVGIITEDQNFSDIPVKDMPLYALANSNRSVITNIDYPNKAITIVGAIIGSSIANLDSRVDDFKAALRGKNKNLDINYNGVSRRFIASANSISVIRKGKQLFARFTVQFVCTEPFGMDTSDTTALSASARTSNSYADLYTFLGTAPYQLPVVTITINSVTGGNTYLSFGNANTGQSVNITGVTFQAGDVLVIDCYNRTVKLNGLPQDYTGAIPEFEPGAQSFNYADGFTTRNFNINIVYKKLYL
jgi:hypothetical protein